MEDTGEDILRQRPSVVTTFFRRIGQVNKFVFCLLISKRSLKINKMGSYYNLYYVPIINLQTYQIWLDKWTPHTVSRWAFTIALVVAFLLRIVLKQVCSSFFLFLNILVVSETIGWFHAIHFRSLDWICIYHLGVLRKDCLATGQIPCARTILLLTP